MYGRATGNSSAWRRAIVPIALAVWLIGGFSDLAAQHPYSGGQSLIDSSGTGGLFDPATALHGEPIESGWLITGSINRSGSSGDADLSIPLRGPDGHGRLYVIADRRAGKWSFELAEVRLDGAADRVDLLERP